MWVWRKFLRFPWTARRSKQSILKEIHPEYLLEGLMWELKFQYFATWCKGLTHWKRLWCWERLRYFVFLGSKITADADCSHEIKRRLLLGRKANANLESILKSRDITLPTKVKAMVFPVVMWELDYKESWVLENWCFWPMVLEKTLESPLDCKEIKAVDPKGN